VCKIYTFFIRHKSVSSTIHTHTFNGPLSGTTRVSRYQKGKTNLDFTGARDSEWQWNPLGYMQVCTSHQTDNHASTPPLCFLQAGCPSCRPTNSVKALTIPSNNFTGTCACNTSKFILPSMWPSNGLVIEILMTKRSDKMQQ